MSKGGIKELRGSFRDPRAEETNPPAPAGAAPASPSARGARPAIEEVMAELSVSSARKQSGISRPVLAGAAAAPAPASSAQPSLRDPFGIVGTTQAEVFNVERVVAHGGFGVIYKANHSRFRAAVALKCLKIPAALSPEQRHEFFERFRAEGEVMFRLSGTIPEVVRPIHVDALRLEDGRFVPFIALEWLEGETLKDVIVKRITEGKRPMSLPRAVIVLTQVARALARAHNFPGADGALAILHCDLKPDNLFVAKADGGEVFKIFDFGIAKVRRAATRVAGGATVADAASSMFTPAYAAPEQWAPDKYGQTGAWTDVFALALTLTEVVTQRPAIDGPPAAMLAQCMDPKKRPTPRHLGLDLAPNIDAIFSKALAVDPKARYQSIEAFWGDLERALHLAPVLGTSRSSMPAELPALPAGWSMEEDTSRIPSGPPTEAATSTPARGVPVLPSLDLDLPGQQVALPPPPMAPVAPAAPQASSDPFALGELDLAGPAPPPGPKLHAPTQLVAAPPPAPPPPTLQAGDGLDVLDPSAFDLVDDPARPGPSASGPAVPPPAPSYPGMAHPGHAQGQPIPAPPGSFPGAEAHPDLGHAASPGARERLQKAAAVAGGVAAKAAVAGAAAAASTAKSLARKAVEVDKAQVRLDDPSTWIKPMRGPMIAMAAAIVLSVGVVVASKLTGSRYSLSWLSLPLFFGALGFAVYRWIKITS
jgi:eukaryotic-like serine/threonine-protein kinase